MSANILFQFPDKVSLLGYRFFNQVTNGQQAEQLSVFHDGQMAQVAIGHDPHARLDTLVGVHRHDGRAHEGFSTTILIGGRELPWR
jgi:hypothetical protein